MKTTQVSAALEYFENVDAQMCRIVREAFCISDSPPLHPIVKTVDEYFPTLVKSIVSQQISTKAAAAIFARLQQGVVLTPNTVRLVTEIDIQAYGVTKQKSRYIVALAHQWPDLEVNRFMVMEDEEIITRLTSCYGIGRWTAEMFLLFALGRPDVFSVGDLALRQQVAAYYNLAPTAKVEIVTLAANWSPYRSIASLALWHQIGNAPALA
jgi:DNA-3-methyladenine glycosylase II